ncbi:MAG: protein-methionine-sulfoxide reductase catalytic subunit MsrP [Caldilineaceae bacterium]|nr:protein-methionine-sulfoxide reductase catalytic subunit MsrP [Caldilineaceae bacterium]
MMPIPRSEITPEHIFLNRRRFMIGVGSAAGALALAACTAPIGSVSTGESAAASPDATSASLSLDGDLPAALAYGDPYASSTTDELGDSLNSFQEITNYNNFYEFTTNKQQVAQLAEQFEPYPWEVSVTGLVKNPQTFSLETLLTDFPQEERIYRLRCVEAWSMVIPWVGFPMSLLLDAVEPAAEAKYVKFTSVLRPEQMAGQRNSRFPWPYVEGLRLDEAMNPLAIFATGMYGKLLPKSNGAPIRAVIPWKYGFKSIKSIVKIEVTDIMPTSTWTNLAANEYGFYANVNPTVNHPRWSQGTERRIGESGRRNTLMFNGYGDEVADLYEGMDLQANY